MRKPDDCDGGWGERRGGQGADDRDPERRRYQAMPHEDLDRSLAEEVVARHDGVGTFGGRPSSSRAAIDSPNYRIVIDYMTV